MWLEQQQTMLLQYLMYKGYITFEENFSMQYFWTTVSIYGLIQFQYTVL